MHADGSRRFGARRRTIFGAAIAGLAWLGGTQAALARSGDTDPVSAVEISGNIGVVSDYRFRGLSRSDRDPAVQAGVDLAFASGWFLGTWASNIAKTGGSDVEVDLYGGYSGRTGGIDYSASVYGYVYPGGSDLDSVELQGRIGTTIGPANLSLLLAYKPDQWNTTRDNLYIGAQTDFGLPGTPLSFRLRGGRENGGYDEKWDWEAGLSYSHRWLTVSASYVDSNYAGARQSGRLGRGGLVGSIIATF